MKPTQGFFLIPDCPSVDPDFDDEWGDMTQCQHEIEAVGLIETHPDSNRLRYDPVPLQQRSYINPPTAELTRREAHKAAEEFLKHQAEKKAEAKVAEDYFKQRQPPVDQLKEMIANSWLHDLLKHLTPDIPLALGRGRIWNNHVMLRKDDLGEFLANDPNRALWPRVWANDTYIVMRMTG